MKRKADSMSTNSVDVEADSPTKKHLRSDDTEDDNPLAITVYDGGSSIEPAEGGKNKKSGKPRKQRQKIDNGPNPPPGLPTGFVNMIRCMGGTDWRLIMQKGLQDTDLSGGHNRLSMPSSHWAVGAESLSSELLMMFEDGIRTVSVPMIDTRMTVWKSVSLRKWHMTKPMLVIACEWGSLVAANELKVKDVVQIWCFKFTETGGYGLAMVKVESGETSSDNNSPNVELTLSLLPSQPYDSCNVPGPSVPPHMPDSSGSSSLSPRVIHYQYQPITCYNFWSTEPATLVTDNNETGDQQRYAVVTDEVVSSEFSKPDDGSHRHGGSLTEVASTNSVLLNLTDTSSSDIDLSLHL